MIISSQVPLTTQPPFQPPYFKHLQQFFVTLNLHLYPGAPNPAILICLNLSKAGRFTQMTGSTHVSRQKADR